MKNKCVIMGLFPAEDKAVAAAVAMTNGPFIIDRVHTPIPSPKLHEAIGMKKSRVGYFTLAGGIFGFLFGFFLAVFTATRWNLIVGGKPVVSLVPFFIVGFENTILFAVIGNILGMLTLSRLPALNEDLPYDERCSGAQFGILASCPERDQERLISLLQTHGGEVKVYDR